MTFLSCTVIYSLTLLPTFKWVGGSLQRLLLRPILKKKSVSD
jgi:hypothetical protein